jgi:hypothetical protein
MCRTSTPWALLPVGEFSCGSVTCWRRFSEWAHAGLFERLQGPSPSIGDGRTAIRGSSQHAEGMCMLPACMLGAGSRQVGLPARGRPPEAAARRAGLEGVEKSLPSAPSTAWSRGSGTLGMLRLRLRSSHSWSSWLLVLAPRCPGRGRRRPAQARLLGHRPVAVAVGIWSLRLDLARSWFLGTSIACIQSRV